MPSLSPWMLVLLIVRCGATVPTSAQRYVDSLSLTRTQFGTFFKATWTSPFNTSSLPLRFVGGIRPLSSSIYNLYARDDDAGSDQGGFPLHRLQSDEAWNFYAGDGGIVLYEFNWDEAAVTNVTIGVGHGEFPQYTVLAQTWVGALLAKDTTWALTGSSNTPGFDPRDSEMARSNATLVRAFEKRFPKFVRLIQRLTSFSEVQV